MKRIQLYLFAIILLFISACNKEDDTAPAVKTLPVYFKALINNVPLVLETNHLKRPSIDSVSNGPGGSAFSSSRDIDTANFIYNSTIQDTRKNKQQFLTIYFANYFNYPSGVPFPGFDKVFIPGMRQFRYDFSKWLGQAVAIQYRDNDGIYWSTSKQYIYATQVNIPKLPTFSGATFELVSVSDKTYLFPTPKAERTLLANIKFNCYLYNSNGDSIHLENAEFQGLFKEIKL
jgi:hypothetical protein